MNFPNTNIRRRHQQGAALIVALIMLLVMTVLGIAAMGVTRMEERMAGNLRDLDIAFQAAEAGLRDGEGRIRTLGVAKLMTTCSAPPCDYWTEDYWTTDFRNQTLAWWTANATEFGVAGSRELTDATRDPLIMMQDMGAVRDSLAVPDTLETGRQYYKITSNATGASDTANVIVESTFVRQYP